MRAIASLRRPATTDPGRSARSTRIASTSTRRAALFMVIDGVGGQAAGGKAADIALTMLRARLERETGPVADRVCARRSRSPTTRSIGWRAPRPEWDGMACVLTAVVVRRRPRDRRPRRRHAALQAARAARIEKVTRDHSPVGEREDAQRDVRARGDAASAPQRGVSRRRLRAARARRTPISSTSRRSPFEPDAALLLCSDGLTDLVDSAAISQIVATSGGPAPSRSSRALIDAANDAGGKDNVTVVYVEGEQFPAAPRPEAPAPTNCRQPRNHAPPQHRRRPRHDTPARRPHGQHRAARGRDRADARPFGYGRAACPCRLTAAQCGVRCRADRGQRDGVDRRSAMQRARPGTTIVVEPGEYRETLTLKSQRPPRQPRATGARSSACRARRPKRAAAIVATGVTDAELDGFRIVGDAATPLGTGVLVEDSELSIVERRDHRAPRRRHRHRRAHAVARRRQRHRTTTRERRWRSAPAPTARIVAQRVPAQRRQPPARRRRSSSRPGAWPTSTGNVLRRRQSEHPDRVERAARPRSSADNWFIDARPPAGTRPTPRGPANPAVRR